MTNTVTPGGGPGGPGAPGNVYAATAPPGTQPATPPAGPAAARTPGSAAATPMGSPAGAPAGAPAPSPSLVAGWLAGRLQGTVGRLRLVALGCVLLGLVLGVTGFYALQTKANGLDQARRDVDQLVTVQQAYTALTEADSQATTLFLTGGLEDPAGRRTYLDRIDLAGRALSRASSGAQDLRTRTDLQAAHVALTRYAGLVEAARANNRQGFPIGVAYLKQASSLLRTDVLPTLAVVQSREQGAVDGALGRGRGALLALVGALVLLLLGLAQWWLFRTSRRIVNLPLVSATAVGLVTLFVVGILLAAAASRSDQARTTGFRKVVSLAEARIAAFDAKSNESLTLIARGNGDRYEKAYRTQLSAAVAAADRARATDPSMPPLSALLSTWGVTHGRIRDFDTGGRWEQAVELATSPADARPPGSNAAFLAFEQPSRDLLERGVIDLDQQLRQPIGQLRFAAAALLLVGLLMALAGWSGVAARLKEFR